METKVLDFENNKVEVLTLEDLGKTVDESFFGDARMNNIRHHTFITRVLEMAAKFELTASCEQVYAAQNKSKSTPIGASLLPALEEKHGKKAIEAHLLRRILTSIIITDQENDESNTALAISYHQDGIEVAFGPHIKICQNLCILGQGKYMKTYGAGRMPGYEKMLEVIGEWFADFTSYREEDLATIQQMKEINVTFRDMAEMVGMLSFMRVSRDDLSMKVNNPLTQKQINIVTKNYLSKYHEFKKNEASGDMSLYEIYNLGTDTLKPFNTEIPNVLYQNNAFSEFILKRIEKA